MKKFLPVVLLMVMMVAACKKDPCEGITCMNGGECDEGKCVCINGYGGEFCQTDLLPDCERNNYGSIFCSNITSKEFNIYINGVYRGWLNEYSFQTFDNVAPGNYHVEWDQTDYIFTPDVYTWNVTVEPCIVDVLRLE